MAKSQIDTLFEVAASDKNKRLKPKLIKHLPEYAEKNSPKVSIIIPCYNKAPYVAEAIESAIKQTYENIEIICVDDASTDNSADIIKGYAEKHDNIKFIDFKENKGVIAARNTAIEKAIGDYILPLDADDIIADTYVEKAAKILSSRPDIGIVYCKVELFGEKNKLLEFPEYQFPNILYSNCILCTALFRKSDFIKVGGYKPYMDRGCEDWDLWLSLIENGCGVYRIDETLFKYRRPNEPTRNDIARLNDDWKEALFNHHLDSYLKDKGLIEKVFFDTKKHTKKLKKYKKLCKMFLCLSIVLALTLLVILVKGFVR